jgi:hypothetical protein
MRPAQRSSEEKYGLAIRQTMASVENMPLTGEVSYEAKALGGIWSALSTIG